jgi:hypothetical protein
MKWPSLERQPNTDTSAKGRTMDNELNSIDVSTFADPDEERWEKLWEPAARHYRPIEDTTAAAGSS